ncbi:sialidase family protein [Candidatus Nitrosocosmicus agrestis]|uniref:sialidase family protein n=1 Tax=Candidatus Nitrosocosmicus agrestis TaxID=2563600 RepID=UPI00122E995A|nr:sialidase family protein [Candidatus Nitrosocosmicus sp. SS]KAA2281550.1 exo-alpha-sialidase [Candidatus Nitrosocosmicus sp. SS]KAF0869753.1 exo-alpha-sialidase [Candidatus Nitrosocosmicus sp. SS]MDR4490348.1 glycoside hydrolase [Candidatus Nitrosocosmicus sp.]
MTSIFQFQTSFEFSWPCIDRSDGKAPIAVSGNNVYVAWWRNSTGNYEVMFKASEDGGQTFGDKINLSNSSNGTSVEADIAAVDDNVYVTFAENKTGTADAYIMTSNDNGKTFNPAVKLTHNSDSKLANKTYMSQLSSYNVKTSPYELKVAAEGDNVYVLATGGEKNSTTYQPDVFIKVSNDSGKTFGKDINLSQSHGNKSDRIQIEAIDGKVYATW